MSRSKAVREEALRLDGYRCAITGFDGRSEEGRKQLEVHHVRPLGMGGSDDLDRVENCITLHAPVHVMVETGQLVIAEWDRNGDFEWDADGILYRSPFSVIDNQNVLGHGVGKVDHKHLWFYRKHDAEEGEEILTQLASFAMLDSTIAERVYRLGQVVDVTDPASRTLRECLAANGLDTRRLIGAANLWQKSLEDTPWPEGMTVSDYRKLRKSAGLTKPREYYRVMIPHPSHRRKLRRRGWLHGRDVVVLLRTAHLEELYDVMERGDKLLQINKFEYGWRAEGGKLFDPEGREVDVIHFALKGAE